MDFPGHYFCRIKYVMVTIPCLVGPYNTINCTLRLLRHRYRVDLAGTGKTSYVESTDGPDPRFSTVNVPIDSITTSTGQNDASVFDFGNTMERYLPFDGARVITTWQLNLLSEFC